MRERFANALRSVGRSVEAWSSTFGVSPDILVRLSADIVYSRKATWFGPSAKEARERETLLEEVSVPPKSEGQVCGPPRPSPFGVMWRHDPRPLQQYVVVNFAAHGSLVVMTEHLTGLHFFQAGDFVRTSRGTIWWEGRFSGWLSSSQTGIVKTDFTTAYTCPKCLSLHHADSHGSCYRDSWSWLS